MADFVNVIKINNDTFSDLKTYLSTNPESLYFSNLSGTTVKIDLKQTKRKDDSAENIVVRWMNEIKKKASSYSSATGALNEIKAYCDAVIVSATSK